MVSTSERYTGVRNYNIDISLPSLDLVDKDVCVVLQNRLDRLWR
jgi:hypothetical protein